MRTYEDVETTLKKYKDELANEAGSKQPHWVVVGGNMCILKKGGSTQYILGKGDPVPMTKHTAESNLTKFQERCGNNIKLSMMDYTEWLNAAINECNHLILCIQKTLAGNNQDVTIPESITPPKERVTRAITITCESCPLSVNTCMTCRFCMGININTYPWEINCGFIKELC